MKSGGGGGQVVSLLALYSDNLSSNAAAEVPFFNKKNENKPKEAGTGPYFKKSVLFCGQ